MNQKQFNFARIDWEAKALTWIDMNPLAFGRFCRLALRYSKNGRTKIGAKLIVELMRWWMDRLSERKPEKSDFLYNNNYTATIAREAVRRHPELADAFTFRGKEKSDET